MKLLLFSLLLSFQCHGMRIISTSPAISEMVARLGAESELVGVTPFCLDGKQAVKVGTALEMNYEKIISLKPDLVLLQENTPGKTSQALSKLKIPFLSLKIISLKDLFKSWRQIAVAIKRPSDKIDDLEKSIESYNFHGMGLFILGGVPNQSVMVAGTNTFYDDLMKTLGLKNIIDQAGWPTLDAEKIRSLPLSKIMIFELSTKESKLWTKKQWRDFCPACQVITWADPRATYPGPSMVKSIIKLLKGKSND